MAGRRRVRDVLVDSPTSLGAWTRGRRWEMFEDLFPTVSSMRVLDLGGTVDAWKRAPVRPRHVTVLNLLEPGTSDLDWILPVLGDACDPPGEVRDGTFDLVFSNSLIEHVGGHARREELAEVVRTSARRHWVQTPNRAFPIEPHFLFPGLQYLPVTLQARAIRRWPLVHTPPRTREAALGIVQWTELIGATQMQGYFPDSEILRGRVLRLPKSLIAVRRG